MPKRSGKKTPGPLDLNELARSIVGRATGEPQPEEPEKDSKAVERGKARADSLSPDERSEIAKKAARTRWGSDEGATESSA